MERGEGASSIVCYMRENGVNEEHSYREIMGLVDEAWKKMNEEGRNIYMSECPLFSKGFVEIGMNLARISHCTYQNGDGHGAPDATSKNRIRALIVEPIR